MVKIPPTLAPSTPTLNRWAGWGGFSWASAKKHAQTTAEMSAAACRRRKEFIAPLFNPLVPMDALRILPQDARRVMKMPREDLRIDPREPVGSRGRRGIFGRTYGFRDRALLRRFDPTILQPLPIDFFKVEITKTIGIFRRKGAAGLKLRDGGEAGGGSVRAIRKHFANGLETIGAEDHVLRDREIKEIPLRHAGDALLPPKGDLQESNIAFIVLRRELIAENRSNEFERLRFLSNAKKINLFRGVHRRAGLHRSELSGEQSKSVCHRHAEARLSESVE